jgi:hypothetical protein
MRRLLKLRDTQGEARASIPADMVCTYLSDRLSELKAMVDRVLVSVTEGNEAEYASYLKATHRICGDMGWDSLSAKNRIAEAIVSKQSYAW